MLLFWDLGARNHEVTLLKIKHIRLNEGYREGEIPREARTGCGPVLLTLWVCLDHVKIHNLCNCLAIMYHSTSFVSSIFLSKSEDAGSVIVFRLQVLSLINDRYRYIMDLTTNGVVITDAIKFVQANKEKLNYVY